MTDEDEQELEDEYADKLTPQIRPRASRYEMPEEQRDTRRRTRPGGVPLLVAARPDEADMTSPFDLFEPERVKRRRPSESALQLAAKLRADRRDAYDLVAEVAFKVADMERAHRDSSSANQQLDADFKTFIERQPGGKEFESIARSVRFWRKAGWIILAGLASSVVGAAIWVGSLIGTTAELRGKQAEEISTLKQEVRDLRDFRRKDSP